MFMCGHHNAGKNFNIKTAFDLFTNMAVNKYLAMTVTNQI
jgi:hypothetical protein